MCNLKVHSVEIMYGPVTLCNKKEYYCKSVQARVVLVKYMVYGSDHHYDMIKEHQQR